MFTTYDYTSILTTLSWARLLNRSPYYDFWAVTDYVASATFVMGTSIFRVGLSVHKHTYTQIYMTPNMEFALLASPCIIHTTVNTYKYIALANPTYDPLRCTHSI
jgi:hypothetical protein